MRSLFTCLVGSHEIQLNPENRNRPNYKRPSTW
jgi:hypothetical protein